MHVQGTPARLLLAITPGLFFGKQGSEINFVAEASDIITHYTIKLPNGQNVTWKKIAGKQNTNYNTC